MTVNRVFVLITHARHSNAQEIELKLNNELQEISKWCDENRIVVNVEKNQDMATPQQNGR